MQLKIEDLLKFIFARFNNYRDQKADHKQWDCVGKDLWNYFENFTGESFVEEISARLV